MQGRDDVTVGYRRTALQGAALPGASAKSQLFRR